MFLSEINFYLLKSAPVPTIQMVAMAYQFCNDHLGNIAIKLNIPLPTVKKTLIELLNKKVISKEGVGKATGYYSI